MTGTENGNHIRVTFVMPALNEEGNLSAGVANVLESLARCGVAGELIIVDDGSRDNTGALADRLGAAHDNISVIHHEKNMGMGGAFWSGVKKAHGGVVVMIPGDGENDAGEILRYLPLLSNVDMVIPYVSNPWVRGRRRRLLSGLYRRIINLTFRLSLNYFNGMVLYRKSVLDGITLRNYGFFYQAELLIKAIRRGHSYVEVPYLLNVRGSGESKATTLRSLNVVVRGYLATFTEVYLRKTGIEGRR